MVFHGERSKGIKLLLLFILLMVIAAVVAVFSVQDRVDKDGQWTAVNDDMNRLLQESADPNGRADHANVSRQQESNPSASDVSSAEAQGNRNVSQEDPGRQLVNINLATVQELDFLPGIGPSKAKAILDYRSASGEFRSIEEIMEVKGIGPQIFGKIKSKITVGDNPDQASGSRLHSNPYEPGKKGGE